MGFGVSKQSYIKTFSRVKATLGIGAYTKIAGNYMDKERPFELVDIQAIVNTEGIVAPTSCYTFGIPITILAKKINAKLTYKAKDNGPEYKVCDAVFQDFHLGM